MTEKIKVKKTSKKGAVQKIIKRGQAHIKASYNNTLITITDQNGNVLCWSSAGICGFKGPKKATPYAAGVIVKNVIEKMKKFGVQEVDIFLKGVGSGRESAVRALHANGINVLTIKDVTPIPHGGCRPKKPRRV
jgi:small subunit ribosomal protein S11